MEFSGVTGFGLFDFTFGIYGGVSMTARDYKFGIASLFRSFPFLLFAFFSHIFPFSFLIVLVFLSSSYKWGLAWSLRTYISHL